MYDAQTRPYKPAHAGFFAFMATAPRLNKIASRLGTVPGRLPTLQDGSWRTDKQSAAARGYGHKWREARAAYLKSHPLCVMCAAMNPPMVTAATVVNHKIPHKGDQSLFWNRDNWEPLCKRHHDSDAQMREKSGAVRAQFDASGRVVW